MSSLSEREAIRLMNHHYFFNEVQAYGAEMDVRKNGTISVTMKVPYSHETR